MEEAIFLSRVSEKVYLIHRRDELRANRTAINKLLGLDNVSVLWDTVVDEIKEKTQWIL